jgi:hypothetical protein
MSERYSRAEFAVGVSVLTLITSIYIFGYKPNYYEIVILFFLVSAKGDNEPIQN